MPENLESRLINPRLSVGKPKWPSSKIKGENRSMGGCQQLAADRDNTLLEQVSLATALSAWWVRMQFDFPNGRFAACVRGARSSTRPWLTKIAQPGAVR